MKKLSTLIILAILLGMGVGLFSNVQSQARQGIKLSPVKIEIKADPGDIVTSFIEVTNRSSKTAKLYAQVLDFLASGEEGEQTFLAPEENAQTYSLAYWIDITKDPLLLAVEEKTRVPFSINIPENAEPGGHYGVIFFGSNPPRKREEGPAVAVGGRMGALVLLTVSGEITEQGFIKEFSTSKKFYEFLPVNFVIRFENTGNVHLAPQGKIEILDLFGKKAAEIMVNETGKKALPNSVRRFEAQWEKEVEKYIIGRYTAKITLFYGNPIKTATAQTSFWIIPWKRILPIFIGLIIVLAIFIFGLRDRIKWIIRKIKGKSETKKPKKKKLAKREEGYIIDLRK